MGVMNSIKRSAAALVLCGAGLSNAAQASLMVSQDGMDITIDYLTSGQTVTFMWDVMVGAVGTADSWIGTTADSLSLQLGNAGQNTNAIVDSISPTATTSANVMGDWTGFLGKVSGNGCVNDNSEVVCYTRETSGTVDSAMETVLAANTLYEFAFDVTFLNGVDIEEILSGFHSVKFLSLKYNVQSEKWSTGDQLSQSGSFDGSTPPDVPVPAPGTLALLGIGLLALGLNRGRHAALTD